MDRVYLGICGGVRPGNQDGSATLMVNGKIEAIAEEEMLFIRNDIEAEAERQKFKFEVMTEKEGPNGWELKIKVTRKIEEVRLELIPIEEMLISRNPRSKDDATLVGHERLVRRGDLVAQGFSKEKVRRFRNRFC